MESTIDLAKLRVMDHPYRKSDRSEWSYFLDRKNKTHTLEHAMKNLKKRRYAYFLYRYYEHPQIVESFFGVKKLGFLTYNELAQVLIEADFYLKNIQPLHPKALDLAGFKTKNNDTKYDVKIEFSYYKGDYPMADVPDHNVQYEGDDEEILEYKLTTKIFFDDVLIAEYDGYMEMEYQYKSFVYKINKAFNPDLYAGRCSLL